MGSFSLAGKSLLSLSAGYRTYLGVAMIIGLGAAQGLGVHIPDWLMWIVGGGTIAAHRQSITGLANAIQDIATMVTITAVPSTAIMTSSTPVATLTSEQKVAVVASSAAFKHATEQAKTVALNNSQKV